MTSSPISDEALTAARAEADALNVRVALAEGNRAAYVELLRSRGFSWEQVGTVMGCSRQTAWNRWAWSESAS